MTKSTFNIVGVSFFPHHEEHLAPICKMFDAPLLTIGSHMPSQEKIGYPGIRTEPLRIPAGIYSPLSRDQLFRALEQYDVILISTLLSREELNAIFGRPSAPPPRIIFCPHGFSEKRQTWSAGAAFQDISLFYGQFGLDQLKEWGVADSLAHHLTTGNYRRLYYAQEREYFTSYLAERGLEDNRPGKVILYAPTWDDALGTSSFNSIAPALIADLSPNDTLIIKPHPLLERSVSVAFDEYIARYPNVYFLRNFPFTYPILEKADCYIGDMSSLAYDFLYFNRPMIFLNQTANTKADHKTSRLFSCGTVLAPDSYEKIYYHLDQANSLFSDERRALDSYVYAPDKSEADLKTDIASHLEGPAPIWMFK